MREDKITVLRNEFNTIIEAVDESMLSDENVIKSAIELEKKLFDFADSSEY